MSTTDTLDDYEAARDEAVTQPWRRRGGRCLHTVFLAFLAFVVVAAPAEAVPDGSATPLDIVHPVVGRRGMVATQESIATRVGVDVLQRGGNAVDAAVAAGFTLAVTLPRAGNLGGGGFMLVHDAASSRTVAIDYRETAPAGARRDMFLNADGSVDREKSLHSVLSAGVPGTVAGLVLAHEMYGTMPLRDLIAPAIDLAEEGILVSHNKARQLQRWHERLSRWPETAKIFLRPDGTPRRAGDRLIQTDLARSLKQIAERGADAFYTGEIAKRIAATMKAEGGLITLDDLAGYRPVIRTPVRGSYRGYEIVSMPPPSSGGIHVIQILNILEGFDLAALGHNGAQSIHLMAEAMKHAYADRSRYLGDPDFVMVPQAGLTAKAYAALLREGIDPERATPSSGIAPGRPGVFESADTTHYSVIDEAGNVVANTYTLNFSYGSGIVVPGTGILLNNEMGDFAAKPGAPDAYGLIGGETNAIEPGKRPLSSMAPTIVFKEGKPFLITGSPGGSRIISTVAQVILNVVEHGMNVAEATAARRIHHQWQPDELRVEQGLSPDTTRLLGAMGHVVKTGPAMGATQSIMRTEAGLFGASDPRQPNGLTLGY